MGMTAKRSISRKFPEKREKKTQELLDNLQTTLED